MQKEQLKIEDEDDEDDSPTKQPEVIKAKIVPKQQPSNTRLSRFAMQPEGPEEKDEELTKKIMQKYNSEAVLETINRIQVKTKAVNENDMLNLSRRSNVESLKDSRQLDLSRKNSNNSN